MTRFAENTSVSVEKSRSEIEQLIVRYGATSTAFMNTPGKAIIAFEASDRKIVFELPLPDIADKRFSKDGRGAVRTQQKRYDAWEQSCRQRWRALALVIKAKLEAVASGITSLEKEFYANIMMPNGQSFYDATKDRVAAVYGGKTVPLLPDFSKDQP